LVVTDTGLTLVIGGLALHRNVGACSQFSSPFFGRWWCVGVAIVERTGIVVIAFPTGIAGGWWWACDQVRLMCAAVAVWIAHIDCTTVTVIAFSSDIVEAHALNTSVIRTGQRVGTVQARVTRIAIFTVFDWVIYAPLIG